ncbi:MAG: branched-chain amino acid aminotransferase [Alphaproteobacteria bacterium]|nr:branched-chain amino acid aminotransferase [Alphaproteobacteria bacterium]
MTLCSAPVFLRERPVAAKTFIDGEWHDGNVPVIGATSHAIWLGSVAFDGARAFEGVTPDLDRHCERVVNSARAMHLESPLSAGEIMEIALDGVRRFGPDAEVYIRPLLYADSGLGLLAPDPDSTRFVLTVFDAPMPTGDGFSACLSPYRRPGPETAPTDAKASCHYPNSSRAIIDARDRGFQNPVMCDALGHVAEFATSNIWIVKDGVAITPVPNGSFLNGITRQRLIGLMRADGIAVEERTVTVRDVEDADEIFNSGNYGKVQPVTRFEDRKLQPGPVYRRARELYWDFAHSR